LHYAIWICYKFYGHKIDKNLGGGFMGNKKIISLCLFIAFLIFPVYVSAAKSAVITVSKSPVDLCLDCHSDKTLTKKLMNKEILSLHINSADFKSSVHGQVGCSGCHTDITLDNHPQVKQIKNKKDYAANLSRNCSICHTNEQLSKRLPIHSSLLAKGTCVECHGSHYIKAVALQKTGVPENQYCMTCHSRTISMRMQNGEILPMHVDEMSLQISAHSKLKCTECHTGFSMTRHPMRSFNSVRAYSIVSSENCWKCHNEAYKQYEVSVHLEQLKGGNVKAPACTDCHGAHSIVSTKKIRTVGLTSCNKCHMDMNSSYEASIHGKALKKGDAKAPVCSSCHNAHDIESTAMSTKIKAGCLKCHKDAGKLHSKWLWNPPISLSTFAAAHFDAASCAACHSTPDAGRAVYLSLYNRKTGKPLSEGELLKVLETDSAGLMKTFDSNGDGSIDPKEFWNISSVLFKKGYIATFNGKMDVRTSADAHLIGAKAEAVRDCEKCHKPNAEMFEDIFVAIEKDEGKPILINAEKDVLTSVLSILPMSKFYVLGLTSIELFDILFIVALIGGIAVPIGHISFRILFSPIRSLRRMGKGGKK
jgi:hypothetical protein